MVYTRCLFCLKMWSLTYLLNCSCTFTRRDRTTCFCLILTIYVGCFPSKDWISIWRSPVIEPSNWHRRYSRGNLLSSSLRCWPKLCHNVVCLHCYLLFLENCVFGRASSVKVYLKMISTEPHTGRFDIRKFRMLSCPLPSLPPEFPIKSTITVYFVRPIILTEMKIQPFLPKWYWLLVSCNLMESSSRYYLVNANFQFLNNLSKECSLIFFFVLRQKSMEWNV